MLNYFRADIRRILANKSHAFSMILLFAAFFAMLYIPGSTAQVTSVSLVASACSILDLMFTFFGLFELLVVFSEDFKVKTMQVAIGLGITRTQVVLCKLLEVMFLVVIDCIMLVLIVLGIAVSFGTGMPMVVLKDLILVLLVKGVISLAVNTSLTMIVLFVTQSTVLSIFVYVMIGLDIVSMLLMLGSMYGFDWIETFKLNRLTISYLVGVLHSRLALGQFSLQAFLGICAYIAVGLFGTCRLFGEQELDF